MQVKVGAQAVSHYWTQNPKYEDVLRGSEIMGQLTWETWVSSRLVVNDVSELPENVRATCGTQLEFVERLKRNWAGNVIAIPGAWKLDYNQDKQDTSKPIEHLVRKLAIGEWLSFVEPDIQYLDKEILKHQARDSDDFHRNFSFWHHPEDPIEFGLSVMDASAASLSVFNEILAYDGQELSAESAIPYAFQHVARCSFRCHPQFDFPSCLSTKFDANCIDFALFLNTSAGRQADDEYDEDLLRVSILNPALLVGVKGPARWEPHPDIIYTSRTTQLPSLRDSQEALCRAVELSLYSLAADTLAASSQIPEWSRVIFGITYDAESVRIVAHIPYEISDEPRQSKLQFPCYSYISCIVDTIAYRGGYPCNKASALDRFRVAMAMVCLRTHATFLAARIEPSTLWPKEVVDSAERIMSLYQPKPPPEEEEESGYVIYSRASPDQHPSKEYRKQERRYFGEPSDSEADVDDTDDDADADKYM